MMSLRAVSLAAVLLALSACSEPMTPAKHLSAGDQAVSAGDFEAALQNYEAVVHWQGEPAPSPADRFKASLESVKCLAALGRAEEGVARFKAMYGEFGSEMTSDTAYRHMLAVLDAIRNSPAKPEAKETLLLDLLAVSSERHQAQKEQFTAYVQKAIKAGASDDMLAKLREMGYL